LLYLWLKHKRLRQTQQFSKIRLLCDLYLLVPHYTYGSVVRSPRIIILIEETGAVASWWCY